MPFLNSLLKVEDKIVPTIQIPTNFGTNYIFNQMPTVKSHDFIFDI